MTSDPIDRCSTFTGIVSERVFELLWDLPEGFFPQTAALASFRRL